MRCVSQRVPFSSPELSFLLIMWSAKRGAGGGANKNSCGTRMDVCKSEETKPRNIVVLKGIAGLIQPILTSLPLFLLDIFF